MGVGGQRHAPAVLLPGKRLATHFTGGPLGPKAGLDGYGKFRSHWDSIADCPTGASGYTD
jgi:hypothetical protein